MTAFRISDLVGVPHQRGSSTLLGADCWGLVELAFFEGRSISVPHYNLEVIGGSLRDSVRAVRKHLQAEVARAWRKLGLEEGWEPYDVLTLRTIVPEDHVALVTEDPNQVLCTSDELGSAYLRSRWDLLQTGRFCGAYRYVGS